jgi:hypothetical protein
MEILPSAALAARSACPEEASGAVAFVAVSVVADMVYNCKFDVNDTRRCILSGLFLLMEIKS